MKTNPGRAVWRGLLLVMMILGPVIGSRMLSVPSRAEAALESGRVAQATGTVMPTQTTTPTVPPTTQPLQIIVEEPMINPTTPDCESGWFEYENERGHASYLALNVQEAVTPTVRGLWTPDLSRAGRYRVEAYIPEHAAVEWDCEGRTTQFDTASARYTIQHALGRTTVTRSQTPLKNVWLNLGDYSFHGGTGGSVSLTDLTGETANTRTVSFSALRFTYLGTTSTRLFVPMVMNQLMETFATGADEVNREVFLTGETFHLVARGVNRTSEPVSARFQWRLDGPCGAPTVVNATVNLARGNWSNVQEVKAPNCTGVFTYTLHVIYPNFTDTDSTRIVVNPPSRVTVNGFPAFDKCRTPTLEEMKTWWDKSPYYTFNLYLGGISLACDNPEMDAFWVASAAQQGWTFIPTWVGPQAPCSRFIHKMSSDPAVARQQGRSEAQAAYNAAVQLGLLGDKVIYYDLEAFSGANQTCRNTVKAFIRGWTERLHELEARAGVYGSPCSSYLTDFSTNNPMPDDVWIAHWIRDYYDPAVGVLDVACLSNNLWPNRQRLRQYTGGHSETWGQVSMTIDSSATAGELAQVPLAAAAEQAGADATLDDPMTAGFGPALKAAQPVGDNRGWALSGRQLFWTDNGGADWREITPQAARRTDILSVLFRDESRGWLLYRSADARLALLRTSDGGQSWQEAPLPELELPAAVQAGYIEFVDEQVGWLALKLESGSSFNLGSLLRTTDGGQTWTLHDLPAGEPVHFSDPDHGWLVDSADGSRYQTQDGGLSWTAVEAPEADLALAEAAAVPFPHIFNPSDYLQGGSNLGAFPEGATQAAFASAESGWAVSQSGECQGQKVRLGEALPDGAQPLQCEMRTRLMQTVDGGRTWVDLVLPPGAEKSLHDP